ncbi:DNA translocase FtsK 4TM domain-containing protein [Candidatus Gracilibacteria bacterium]|nr:DNA translocase FtsK 4TM domain-containing protein [Candidatus Gracilibacteria bacterium]
MVRRRNKSSSIFNLITGSSSRRKVLSNREARRLRARGKGFKLELEYQVAREIFAIIYLALSLLIVLSIYGGLGRVGEAFSSFLRPMFGFGIHLVPVLFFGLSLSLFFAKKTPFTFTKITGIVLFFTSLLSIFHLSVPVDGILTAAQAGEYGGYIGFISNFFFRSVLQIGNLGSTIVFVASFIVGGLMTFEFSIVNFLKEARPEIRLERRGRVKETEDGVIEIPEEDEQTQDDINIIKPLKDRDDRDDVDFVDDDEDEDDEENEGGEQKRPEIGIIRGKKDEAQQPVVSSKKQMDWVFPPLDILDKPQTADAINDDLLKEKAEKIRTKLEQFGIDVVMSDVHVGPTVVQYTLKPHEGVKLSKITGLKNDLALTLAAPAIRIEAPIPGKSLVGIEIPNEQRTMVRLREMLETEDWKEIGSQLRMPLGRTVSGKPMVIDLASMPHILIAGATGAGKSVGMNSFLMSLLYQNSPQDLKLIMVDPKRVELNTYNGIPHLLTPVITDVEKAATALRWAVAEMNRRYIVLADTGHRNISDYNADSKIEQRMPKIVIVIDELADLMMAAGKDVEASICRIAQMARAVGMHLMVATQRPSVDVITGLIKANIPARVAYAVTSGIDSRTILDCIGAEDLLGKGDMLFISGQMSKPVRIQGIYVSSKEIERVTNRVKLTIEPEYDETITSSEVARSHIQGLPNSRGGGGNDPMYQRAMAVVVESRKASASLLQRRLEIGYARAARILDEMESNGVIGPVRGAKPREIYVTQTAESGDDAGAAGQDSALVSGSPSMIATHEDRED